jgi:hypothetical protein
VVAGIANRALLDAAALLEQSWDAPQDFGLSLEATLAASRARITAQADILDYSDRDRIVLMRFPYRGPRPAGGTS